MKTATTYYRGDAALKRFVKKEKIDDSRRLLIQVFSGRGKRRHLEKVAKTLARRFKKAHIIGATTDGEIADSKVTTG